MKKIARIFFVAVALCVLTSIASAQQNKAEQMYQQALYDMEGKGDYAKAIESFNLVMTKFPKEKATAAKALLNIGRCYEKLGKDEAQKAYERVIKEYGDQREVVAEARARLAVIVGKENKEFSIRKVKEGTDVGFEGAVSPDGRYLSYVDWDTGDLAIYEIATGNKRRLTDKGSWDKSNEFAYYSRWSPDGKQVVYDWYTVESLMELRIVGFDGSKPRILYSNKEVVWSQTYGWSPDGKQILASLFKENGQNQIVLVSTADGSIRVLKTLEQGFWDHMNFSPDGHYIVYDFPQKEDSPERDIFLLSTDGSREIPLVEHPANDYVLGWAPDGKNILFASDRRNSLDVWVIQFSDGKVQETPKPVTSNIGQVCYPKGFTQKGSFYYDIYNSAYDIYFAELDPETGKMLAPPKKLSTRFEGSLHQPEYSPDGKYIAYISKESSALSIQSLETGKMQEFPSKLSRNIISPRWFPDGRSILVGGWDLKGKKGIYRIDTQSGIFTLIVPPAKVATENFLGAYEWSRDGKAIFLERFSDNLSQSHIMLREIESGTEKELYRESTNYKSIFLLSCSPDGKWLAFLTSGKEYVLRIMPAAGGEYRELYRFKKESYTRILRWTPDGKYILFEKFQPAEKKYSLWRIPIEGGEPQKLGLESDSYIVASVHPDGRHIVFSSPGSTGENSGNWVMENFLPKGKK